MSRQGYFVENLMGELSYKSFKPTKLPPIPNILLVEDIFNLFTHAYFLLGELNGKSSFIPNMDLYITMYVRKEALLSSQIEGTQATLEDVLDPNIDENVDLDKKDVINYIKAINYANDLLKELPLSNRFIKEVHKVLIKDSRGGVKNPGEFRTSQNWIGPVGSTLKSALFVPPNVNDMNEALSDLESFIHYDDSVPKLIKVALIHYQFETIHPFLDGNGRVGRLLIDLLFKEYGLLNSNIIYISYYLKKNRREYYDRLMDVRLKGHYEQWVKFFLNAVIESTIHSIKTIDSLVLLDNKNINLINTNIEGNKSTVLLLFEYIKTNPIFSITHAAKTINKTYNATSSAVNKLIDLNILQQRNNQDRNRTFIYAEYLNILKDDIL